MLGLFADFFESSTATSCSISVQLRSRWQEAGHSTNGEDAEQISVRNFEKQPTMG